MQNNLDEGESRKMFWMAYFITVILVIFRGPDLSVPLWLIGVDDTMRLVEVRDLLGGQSWFDLTQYRLGTDGGTAIHWSRVIDLPIAIMIKAFSLVMPMDWAEAATMILWPILLIGPTLWAMSRAAIRFGGAGAGIFGLIFGGITIVVSQKFDAGSLDHHNVQMMLMAIALMAMMSQNNTVKNGTIAGIACAASLVIGLETLLFVAAISGAVAMIWLWIGQEVQGRTIGFSAAFVVTLVAAFLLTRPDLSVTAFQCDAFDENLLLLGSFGAGGLMLLSLGISRQPRWVRITGVLALGAGVLLVAKLYAPSCLANPLDQLHPVVATDWLGNITEAKPLIASIKADGAVFFGLLIVPVIALIYTVIFMQYKRLRPQALVLFLTISAAYALTFYQLRGLFFILVLCSIPIAGMLGRLYVRYQKSRTVPSGILVIVVLIISVPDLWSMAYIQYKSSPSVEGARAQLPAPVSQFDTCIEPGQFAALSKLPVGWIAASSDMGAFLLRHTPHSVLSSNFHRNQDGIRTGIELAKADLATAHSILIEAGIDYVVYCRNDGLPLRTYDDSPHELWSMLYKGETPDFLTPAYENTGGLIYTYKVLK